MTTFNSPLQPAQTPSRIAFHHTDEHYHSFTNYSPHTVYYNGKCYPTGEHLFQSLKFAHRPDLAEHIRTCAARPGKVHAESHRFDSDIRPDWKHVEMQMMDLVLWHKFSQHEDIKRKLLQTGDAMLVNDSDHSHWGIGKDGKGGNELGKSLERLRARLRTPAC